MCCNVIIDEYDLLQFFGDVLVMTEVLLRVFNYWWFENWSMIIDLIPLLPYFELGFEKPVKWRQKIIPLRGVYSGAIYHSYSIDETFKIVFEVLADATFDFQECLLGTYYLWRLERLFS